MTLLLERVRRVLAPGLQVERELGSGGMGIVFLARDLALDREVAVKVLRPEQATATAAERFLREARLLARVRHPGVVQVHLAGEADGLFYFVMDLVSGRSLAERLRTGPLGAAETVAVGRDLLAALAAVHAQGVVHRDIKPANVFFENGRALLADFGIARTSSEEGAEPLTRPGASPGTPDYMAPEQLRGAPATTQTDLYAAGMLLYECATGRRWPALAEPAAANWSSVPASLAGPLRRALALAPGERWPDAMTFREALVRPRPRRAVTVMLTVGGLGAVAWLLRAVTPVPAGDSWSMGGALPQTAEGQRLWARAESDYRAGRWREADEAYGSARDRDSTCLACQLRMVELDRWLEEDRDTAGMRVLAGSVGRFSPAWRDLVRSIGLPASRRLALLDSVTTGYRDFPAGWYYLGEELFNRGPLFGRSRSTAVEALSRAVRLDSTLAAPKLDLALALIAEGDAGAAESEVAAVNRLPKVDGLADGQRALMNLAFGYRFRYEPQDEAGRESVGLEAWRALTADTLRLYLPQAAAGPRVLAGVGSPEGALDLGRRYEAWARDRGQAQLGLRRSGLLAQMFALVALGRPTDATLAAGRFLSIATGPEHRLFQRELLAAPAILDPTTPRVEIAAISSGLDSMLLSAAPAPFRREAAWLAALAALRLDDSARAGRILRASLADEPMPRLRALLVEGALLAFSDRPRDALGLTDSARLNLEGWDAEKSPFLRAAFQLERGRWQAATSRDRVAGELRWHQHFHLPDYPTRDTPEPAEGDWALSTLASWELARTLEQNDQDVCAAYRLVHARWRGGEPRFRARADTAEARFIALGCAR